MLRGWIEGPGGRLRLFSLFQSIVFLALLTQCGKAPEQGEGPRAVEGSNRPPVVKSAVIKPAVPTVLTDLWLDVDASDPDGDLVEYQVQWLVNGEKLLDETAGTLSRDSFKKGDEVQCVIVPTDGEDEGPAYETAPVLVADALPVIEGVRIETAGGLPDAFATAVVKAHDPDGDPIAFHYRWSVNDQEVEGDQERLSLGKVKKGDRITVEVTIEEEGAEKSWTESRTILIQNRPPVITSKPPSSWNPGQGFQYRVGAMDPDGDPVSIRLEGEIPPGMALDEKTHTLTWKPAAGAGAGSYKVSLIAEDADGATFQQDFVLTLGGKGKKEKTQASES